MEEEEEKEEKERRMEDEEDVQVQKKKAHVWLHLKAAATTWFYAPSYCYLLALNNKRCKDQDNYSNDEHTLRLLFDEDCH